MVALGACQVDISVEVQAAAAGSGRVRVSVVLDREAAAEVPDLATELRVDDLVKAGWVLEGPAPLEGKAGSVRVAISRPFTSPAGAAQVIEELGAAGGPFSSLRLTRRSGFWKTRTELKGQVDLSAGLGAFGDPGLTAKLGANLGLDAGAIQQELGRPLGEAVTVELVGRLPGRVAANASSARGGARVWPVILNSRTAVSASSEAWNTSRVVGAGFGAASGLALIAVLVRRRRQRR